MKKKCSLLYLDRGIVPDLGVLYPDRDINPDRYLSLVPYIRPR